MCSQVSEIDVFLLGDIDHFNEVTNLTEWDSRQVGYKRSLGDILHNCIVNRGVNIIHVYDNL